MIAKLAFGNVRKSLRDFAVYFATVALGVAVFYAFLPVDQTGDGPHPAALPVVGLLPPT